MYSIGNIIQVMVYIDLQIKKISRRLMCSPGAGTPQKCCVQSAQYLRSDLIEWHNRYAVFQSVITG